MSYHSPRRDDRNPPANNRQLITLLTLFLGSIFAVIWGFGLLVDRLVYLIPVSAEQQLGKLIVPTYEQQARNSPAQVSLNRLLDRLEDNLDRSSNAGSRGARAQTIERNYQVLYIPKPTVNALAIPGDTIVLYQGLIEAAESENELMMVLGHELGHFANRDHLRGLGKTILLRVAIASVIGDSSGLEAVIGGAITNLSQSHYCQSQEKQADEFGLTLLNKTYGYVAGATDFFERIGKKEAGNLAFLSTHPAPKDRVENLEKLIEQRKYKIGKRSPLPPSLTF